jgi:hypothetical protein
MAWRSAAASYGRCDPAFSASGLYDLVDSLYICTASVGKYFSCVYGRAVFTTACVRRVQSSGAVPLASFVVLAVSRVGSASTTFPPLFALNVYSEGHRMFRSPSLDYALSSKVFLVSLRTSYLGGAPSSSWPSLKAPLHVERINDEIMG